MSVKYITVYSLILFFWIMMYSYQNADNTINVSMYRNLKSEKYTKFKKGLY